MHSKIRSLITALAAALLLAPAQAAAQELVRVSGTVHLDGVPFAPTRGVLMGLLASPDFAPWGEPIEVVISGNQATYEGYAFAASEICLNVAVRDGSGARPR